LHFAKNQEKLCILQRTWLPQEEWATATAKEDNIRLLFAYTDLHVPRAGKLEVGGGSMQGLRREHPRARRVDACTTDHCQMSSLP
jgi:hypothetical protein